ncbi:MAG TPA: TraR/DksA family transcriptional regulator, partial [Burkholderiales bacterium]|nr:TraR/DksA family transcriptional regulator [Burkholderiales bacterium]
MTLTEKQIQELQGAIEHRRSSLTAELRDDVERVRRDRFEDLAGAAPDPGDESVATLIADLGHADMERDLSELR